MTWRPRGYIASRPAWTNTKPCEMESSENVDGSGGGGAVRLRLSGLFPFRPRDAVAVWLEKIHQVSVGGVFAPWQGIEIDHFEGPAAARDRRPFLAYGPLLLRESARAVARFSRKKSPVRDGRGNPGKA